MESFLDKAKVLTEALSKKHSMIHPSF